MGVYVYCVVRAADCPPLDGLQGVDPGSGVQAVTHADLTALCSRVPDAVFAAEALARNLEDLAWVERTARAHDAIIARARAADAVVPLRLCTIFRDQARVREMLEREREALTDALTRVAGQAEWSVKLLADPATLEMAVGERAGVRRPAGSGEEASSPGRAFFARKQHDRAVRDEARAIAQEIAVDAHERLRRAATAATLLRPQDPGLSGRPGRMLLNGAYLVERSRAGAFETVARELDERCRPFGLRVEIAGPWAPYNFVASPQGDPT